MSNEIPEKSEYKFCQTPGSRFGKLVQIDGVCGPFDEDNTFYQDLTLFMQRPQYRHGIKDKETVYRQLIDDIQMMHDTYFYTSSLLSLLVIGSDGTQRIYNADTYMNYTRTIEDWDINSENSIGHYFFLEENKNTVFVFPQVLNVSYKYFFGIDGKRTDLDEKYPGITNTVLIYKNTPVDMLTAKGSEFQACSIIVQPLWADDQPVGAIIIAYNMSNCYTNLMKDILPAHLLNQIELFTNSIALILKQFMI